MPKYAQSKQEFFHNGVDNQKTPDIIVDLKRVSTEQISLWPREQRSHLIQWLSDCERSFDRFRQAIIEASK